MKHATDDGKHLFDTEQEVFDYEAKVAAEKVAKEKLKAEKEGRREEIKVDYQTLLNKIEQYNKDYNEHVVYGRDTANLPIDSHYQALSKALDELWRKIF